MINIATLSTLIKKVKKVSSGQIKKSYCSFFLIEPFGAKYIIYKVSLLNPFEPKNDAIDFENISPIDSTKVKKK